MGTSPEHATPANKSLFTDEDHLLIALAVELVAHEDVALNIARRRLEETKCDNAWALSRDMIALILRVTEHDGAVVRRPDAIWEAAVSFTDTVKLLLEFNLIPTDLRTSYDQLCKKVNQTFAEAAYSTVASYCF